MTSGADLFVVCKQCGSEVSPYITECPYCGNRLRRRAPKLPRVNAPPRPTAGRSRLGAMLARPGRKGSSRPRRSTVSYGSGRGEGSRPNATIAIVALSCVAWVAWHAGSTIAFEMAIVGPLHGHWWRLVTSQFVYYNGVYAFTTLVAVAIFGWLLERRHGPAVVLALFLGAGAAGSLLALAVYPFPLLTGANAGALALLAAWAAPDVRAARTGDYYEGDLLGATAIAALVLAMPFAVGVCSWLAGVAGAAIGLLAGLGLSGLAEPER
jgi:membrane associated rhomboid family serine protease